jgi:ATP-dependent 26S proteasome regulatory subunit
MNKGTSISAALMLCLPQMLAQVSRRLLSVLLREIDGFDTSGQKAVLIGATNRRSDLDAALLSRWGA